MNTAARLRVMIVDDEPHARATLKGLVEADRTCEVVGEAADGREGLQLLTKLKPDVVFLDIQMPGMTGTELVDALPEHAGPLIVFVTAYDAHAIRAFEVGAVDYVLKPFDDERFGQTLSRVKHRWETRRVPAVQAELKSLIREFISDSPDPKGVYLQRIPVKNRSAVEFVDVDVVDWIEASDYYVRLHIGRSVTLVRSSLTRLESQLDPRVWIRVHRSAMVKIAKIQRLEPSSHGDQVLRLTTGVCVKVSRSRRQAVCRALGIDESDTRV